MLCHHSTSSCLLPPHLCAGTSLPSNESSVTSPRLSADCPQGSVVSPLSFAIYLTRKLTLHLAVIHSCLCVWLAIGCPL